jgi:hypothetical protein
MRKIAPPAFAFVPGLTACSATDIGSAEAATPQADNDRYCGARPSSTGAHELTSTL